MWTMAPETITSSQTGRKLDSWSLGVLLFFMATYNHPFTNKKDTFAILKRNITGEEPNYSWIPESYSSNV